MPAQLTRLTLLPEPISDEFMLKHTFDPARSPARLSFVRATTVSLVLICSFETPIAVASFLYVAVYLSGFSALFAFRMREPELSRPSRCWIPMDKSGCPCCLSRLPAVVCRSGSLRRFFTLVTVALSYPAYFLAAVRGRRVPHLFRVINPTDP